MYKIGYVRTSSNKLDDQVCMGIVSRRVVNQFVKCSICAGELVSIIVGALHNKRATSCCSNLFLAEHTVLELFAPEAGDAP